MQGARDGCRQQGTAGGLLSDSEGDEHGMRSAARCQSERPVLRAALPEPVWHPDEDSGRPERPSPLGAPLPQNGSHGPITAAAGSRSCDDVGVGTAHIHCPCSPRPLGTGTPPSPPVPAREEHRDTALSSGASQLAVAHAPSQGRLSGDKHA